MFLNSRNVWLVGVSSENEQKKNAANLPYYDETTIFRQQLQKQNLWSGQPVPLSSYRNSCTKRVCMEIVQS